MRIKEIEARLAAIKQEIEERGDAMKAEEIDALENETKELTEERAGLIAAAEKRNGILDNIAKGGGADTDISARSYFDGVIEREQQERLERRKQILKIKLMMEV